MNILSLRKGAPCLQTLWSAPLILLFLITTSAYAAPPLPARAASLLNTARPRVQQELQQKGFQLGQPIFVRIFKMPGTLEVWIKKNSRYQLFKEYPICSYSGYPGPKLQEGDWQSPEGFYSVPASRMNPDSSYHLAFNIGYPNEFDREWNRTGSSIMVHGECSSRGCFAMGNLTMEEIYLLAHSALAAGQQEFSVHVFPFPLTDANLAKYSSSPWIDFWQSLQPGYLAFERTRTVPVVTVQNGSYVVRETTRLALVKAGRQGRRK